MSYHKNEIPEGVYGELSKVKEEFYELMDAREQGSKVMELIELSDLVGAIEGYIQIHYGMEIDDLRKFSNITKRAFKSGSRPSKKRRIEFMSELYVCNICNEQGCNCGKSDEG